MRARRTRAEKDTIKAEMRAWLERGGVDAIRGMSVEAAWRDAYLPARWSIVLGLEEFWDQIELAGLWEKDGAIGGKLVLTEKQHRAAYEAERVQRAVDSQRRMAVEGDADIEAWLASGEVEIGPGHRVLVSAAFAACKAWHQRMGRLGEIKRARWADALEARGIRKKNFNSGTMLMGIALVHQP